MTSSCSKASSRATSRPSSTAGSVTTLVFGSGQTVFVSNIETLRFQDGSEQHPPFPTIT